MTRGTYVPPLLTLALCALAAGCDKNTDTDYAAGDDTDAQICVPSGEPVSHTSPTIIADETWASGIHVVPQTITVRDGATLTIAPCSEVRLAEDASLDVDLGGVALIAEGTADEPIAFVRADAASAWGQLSARTPATISLAHATLTGGGGTITDVQAAELGGASVAALGDDDVLPPMLGIDHVTISGSTGFGVMMVGARFTTGSTDLTITGSGYFPLYIGADAVTEIPTGSYTDNATDEILLQTYGPANLDNKGAVLGDVTMHDRGVPYRVGASSSSIRIGDGFAESPTGLLTIEAGVTLKFNPQDALTSGIEVRARKVDGDWEAQGALVVDGTAEAPVRFTSASPTPAPGDWQGLYFSDIVDPRSRITHAIVEYAGADSATVGYCPSSVEATNNDADCSVILQLQDYEPPTAFITESDIHSGLGCGIYRGWKGEVVDFQPTNQFADLTGCDQSGVRVDEHGTCSACE